MTIETTDYSLPPQWVLDLYDPDKIRPHVLVSEGESPNTYLIGEVDFHAINLFATSLTSESLPTKGEARTFEGTPSELYEELLKLDAKVLLAFSARNVFSNEHHIPMSFGYSSYFSLPALVFANYKHFLNDEKRYVENPEQVGLAYEFINNHPLFWHPKKVVRAARSRRSERNEGAEQNVQTEELEIVTECGWQHLQWLMFNKQNKETGAWETTVTIETGPGNYHDYNLDVYAPSFDAAVLEMAKLIHKHYDSHGGFTDKTKKEPNDNFFREADAEAEAQAEAEEQETINGIPVTGKVIDDLVLEDEKGYDL